MSSVDYYSSCVFQLIKCRVTKQISFSDCLQHFVSVTQHMTRPCDQALDVFFPKHRCKVVGYFQLTARQNISDAQVYRTVLTLFIRNEHFYPRFKSVEFHMHALGYTQIIKLHC